MVILPGTFFDTLLSPAQVTLIMFVFLIFFSKEVVKVSSHLTGKIDAFFLNERISGVHYHCFVSSRETTATQSKGAKWKANMGSLYADSHDSSVQTLTVLLKYEMW
jgi:hypothetical protein